MPTRPFSMCYVAVQGLEALLRETRIKLGVQHRVREWLLACYKSNLARKVPPRLGHLP